MNKENNIFRKWVPKWLAIILTGCMLIVSLLSFALYYSNMRETIAYYGFEQADIQFSVVLMYATVVTYLALDNRLIKYFAVRNYIVCGLIVNTISYIVCFYTKNYHLFMACRFVQGFSCALLCSAVMHLSFPLFQKSKSRIYGYSMFYGGLQISIPVCAIYCSQMLKVIGFNYLFYGLCVFTLSMLLIVMFALNGQGRFYRKISLYQIDWKGFIYYTVFCVLAGYLLVYARSFGGFESVKFSLLTALAGIVLLLLVFHELRVKRPLINLRLFKNKRFIGSLCLLSVFYIFKGTIIFVYNYAENILHVESINMIPMWCMNIAGVSTGTCLTARYLINKYSLHTTLVLGFSLMGSFHLISYFTFSSVSDISDLYFPVFIYGLATSTLFVPLVMFAVSTVPESLIPAVAPLGIFARFMGFCISICLNNYHDVYINNSIFDKIREWLIHGNSVSLFTYSSVNYFALIFMTISLLVVFLAFTPWIKRE